MDFGFSLSKSSTVNLDTTDLSLYERVHEIEPDVAICMACGSCSATCTSVDFSGMSLRRVILDIQRGREEEARKMLSGCMLCGKCTMVCPRGINTRRLILTLGRVFDGEDRNTRRDIRKEVRR